MPWGEWEGCYASAMDSPCEDEWGGGGRDGECWIMRWYGPYGTACRWALYDHGGHHTWGFFFFFSFFFAQFHIYDTGVLWRSLKY